MARNPFARGLFVMSISAARIGAMILGGAAVLGLVGCAQPVAGTGAPAPATPTTTAQQTSTVVVVPTVTVTPPATVTVTPAPKAMTPCQRMFAAGYSYDAAYAAWVDAGKPLNWDADKDGFPCEQSYGELN
jgi:hypothetical protein